MAAGLLASYILSLSTKKPVLLFNRTGMYTKIYPWYHLNYRKDLRSLSAFNARPTSPLLAAALGSLLESVIHTSSVMRFSLSRTHFERILMLLLFVMAFIMCTLYHFKKKMSRLLSAFSQNSQQHTAQNLFAGEFRTDFHIIFLEYRY